MPEWFAAVVPLVLEPPGQLVHELPASLYAPTSHTVQLASTLEPATDPVPAGQSSKPTPTEVLVPTGPPPAQYLFSGQLSGESLSGVPGM